jgi:ABC-2 type transport system permease protein
MNALHVAVKDIQMLLKDRGQVITLFILPLIFVVAFSAVFAAGQPQEQAITVPVVDLDAGGEMSQQLLDGLNRDRGLKTQDQDPATVDAALADKKITMALFIPANFTADVKAGTPATLRLVRGPGGSESETEAVRLIVSGVASDLALQTQLIAGLSQMGQMMGDAPAEYQTFQAERIQAQAESQFNRASTAPLVALTTRWPDKLTQGREDFNPSSLSVVGFAILFAFLTAQSTAESIYNEKKIGTFRRLLASPLGKWPLLSGKMLPNFVIAIVQVAIVFGVSALLLPLMKLGKPSLGTAPSAPLGLILTTVMVALCSTSLGVLIAALARTAAQIGGISTVVLWVAGMVGGAFIPTFMLGDFLNTIGKVVPHYWAIQAYNDIMIRNQGLVDILPELGMVAAFTVVFFAVGLLRFKFD